MNRSTGVGKILIFFVTFILLITGFSSSVYAEEEFDIEVKMGFNGYAKYQALTPFDVIIKNNSEDLNGKVQLLFQDSYANKKLYTAYTKELTIAKGTTKTVDFQVMLKARPVFKVRILDEKGNIASESSISVGVNAKDPSSLSMGILSDDFDSLNYLASTYFTRVDSSKVFYDKVDLSGAMPDKGELLDTLDVIVINNYSTERLTSDQIEALRQWTERGGLLIIGTGPNYQKTLQALGNINFVRVDRLENITDFTDLKTSAGGSLKSAAPLNIIRSENDDQYKALGSEKALIYRREIGRGNVMIFTFDLGLGPFVDWSQNAQFISEVISGYVEIPQNVNIKYSGPPSFYRSQDITGSIPVEKLPSVKMIVGILAAFLVVVGPINYIVLKKLDKREKGWITIPVIVFAFAAFIYFWGFGTRFDRPIANNVSVVNLSKSGDSAEVTTLTGILGFRNGDLDISTSSENPPTLPENIRGFNYMSFEDESITLEYIMDKEEHIVFKNRGLWDAQHILRKNSIKLNDFIDSDIKLKGNKVTGTVKNMSESTLEDMILLLGTDYIRVGTIAPEDSKSFSKEFSNYYLIPKNRGGLYSLMNSLYPYQNNYMQGSPNNNGILNNNLKREILNEYLETSGTDFMSENIKLVAWSQEPLVEGVVVNGEEAMRTDRNLVIIPTEIQFEKGVKVEIPKELSYAEIIDISNMNFERGEMRLFGDGYTVFSFKPNVEMDLESMNIDIIDRTGIEGFSIEIYNTKTGSWDSYGKSHIMIDDSNRDIYYDEEKGTIIKVDPSGHNDVGMPRFSIKGVVK